MVSTSKLFLPVEVFEEVKELYIINDQERVSRFRASVSIVISTATFTSVNMRKDPPVKSVFFG